MTYGEAWDAMENLVERLEARAENDKDIADAIPWIEQFRFLSVRLMEDTEGGCPADANSAAEGYDAGIERAATVVDERFVWAAEGII